MQLFLLVVFVIGFLVGGSSFPGLFVLEVGGPWYSKLFMLVCFIVLVQIIKIVASIVTVVIVPTEKGRITYSILFFTILAAGLTSCDALFEALNFSLGGILLISFFFALLELIRDDKQQVTP